MTWTGTKQRDDLKTCPFCETPARETGTVERLVARAEGMNGAMKAGGLYLRLGDYTDEDAALDREAASELTRLKARADADRAKLATAREALKACPLPSTMGNVQTHYQRFYDWYQQSVVPVITEGADHERS